MQIESNISQTCLDLLPRCSLSYAKILNLVFICKKRCIFVCYKIDNKIASKQILHKYV